GVDAAQQVLEIGEVGDLHVLLVAEFVDDAINRVAADLPGIQRLRRAAARAGTRGKVDAVATLVLAHESPFRCLPISAIVARTSPPTASSFFHKSTVSSAASAASSPLLPCAPPARACASAWRSTASTPLMTGSASATATCIRPCAQPSATCS